MSRSFLIIQTAFTGDAILATSVAESLYNADKKNTIDILVRKGNESLFKGHPIIRNILVWDKKTNKYSNLFSTLKKIRENKYDVVINLQRFASTGFLTAFSNAKTKVGFNKNPLSFLFSKSVKHIIEANTHEIDRNFSLLNGFVSGSVSRPKIYPADEDFKKVIDLKKKSYITIAPSSVWFTKTFPAYKWMELIKKYNDSSPDTVVYLLGSKDEFEHAEYIKTKSGFKNVKNLCGTLSLLESAALMKDAEMNYVNDSAPLHLASAVNAPVTAVYCSTVPLFGFGPLSDNSRIVETKLNLNCRPCGLHGFKECPLTHFKCAHSIEINDIFSA